VYPVNPQETASREQDTIIVPRFSLQPDFKTPLASSSITFVFLAHSHLARSIMHRTLVSLQNWGNDCSATYYSRLPNSSFNFSFFISSPRIMSLADSSISTALCSSFCKRPTSSLAALSALSASAHHAVFTAWF
jgi:hypothetical protein